MPLKRFFPNPQLAQSYFAYSALLVLKLLALVPLAEVACKPDKVKRANLNDLKYLTPFWLLSGLFMTTGPDTTMALNLLRGYVVARFVAALTYILEMPKMASEYADLASYAITGFMGAWVIYSYKDAL